MRCPYCHQEVNYELDNFISFVGLIVGLIALSVFTVGIGLIPSLFIVSKYGGYLLNRIPDSCPHCGKKPNQNHPWIT